MNEQLLHIITQVAEVCFIPLFGYLTTLLINKINTKLEADKKKAEAEIATRYLNQLNDTVATCVRATTQTYVAELKASGSFDKEAQKAALEKTLTAAKATLSDEALKYLAMFTSDLDTFIANKIEAFVVEQKLTK